MKKYTVNENYFERIDSNDKSYFLGLLYADGCVANSKSRGKEISLGLIDLDVIEKFKYYIESTHLIYKLKKKQPHNAQPYRISIINNKLYNDLVNLGCVPRKSLILKFPFKNQIPENLVHHFIRGYFDGDGCIYTKNFNKTNVQIAGTFDVLNNIQTRLDRKEITSRIKTRDNFYILKIDGNNNLRKFFDYIYYEHSEIYMDRKFKKFNDLFKERELRFEKNYNKKCSLVDCDNKHLAKGFCVKHYHTNIVKIRLLQEKS